MTNVTLPSVSPAWLGGAGAETDGDALRDYLDVDSLFPDGVELEAAQATLLKTMYDLAYPSCLGLLLSRLIKMLHRVTSLVSRPRTQKVTDWPMPVWLCRRCGSDNPASSVCAECGYEQQSDGA